MSAGEFLFLLVAGVAGGLAGSVAGLASLPTYPALLAVGLPPIVANVTNTVSLLFSTAGSVLGSRVELAGQGPRIRPLAVIAAAGGVSGAALLLLTPEESFERIVPWLLGFASLTILVPRRQRPAAHQPSRRASAVTGAAVFAVAIYGGYFGAAAGVLVLALLLFVHGDTLPRANALKNVLVGAANGVAAVGFAIFAPVAWSAVLPLGLGCLAGARLGPAIVRRLPAGPLRIGIGVAGLVLAVRLGVEAYA